VVMTTELWEDNLNDLCLMNDHTTRRQYHAYYGGFWELTPRYFGICIGSMKGVRVDDGNYKN